MNSKPDPNFFRPSASVIIASKFKELEYGYDYRLLLFKRSPETAYAPKHCVFPGGTLDVADESIEWLRYFQDCGISIQSLESLILVHDQRPEFLASQGTGCYDRFFKKEKIWARDISLRITAIRETFEEVGILLCRKRNFFQQQAHNNIGQFFEEFERTKWQQLVHNDAKQFLVLCQELNVIPDLWCLHEWSAWSSSPTASRKFDTIFYFVALNSLPNLLPESSEVSLAMWQSPVSYIEKFNQHILWLPFLIFYELSRISNIKSWEQLFKFSKLRSTKGSIHLVPTFFRCIDGLVAVLPGDDVYPQKPKEQTESIVTNQTVSNFRKNTKNRHRIVFRDMHDLVVDLNILPFNDHLSPNKAIVNKL